MWRQLDRFSLCIVLFLKVELQTARPSALQLIAEVANQALSAGSHTSLSWSVAALVEPVSEAPLPAP